MIELKKVQESILNLPKGFKAKDLDALIKDYYKLKEEVSYDEELLTNNVLLQKAFFYINLKLIKSDEEKFLFIDKYKDVFYYWYCTDLLINQVQNCNYDFMLKYATKYVKSKKTYTRRWGYVMFITNKNKKDLNQIKKVLPLFHDDDEETIQMGEAWVLCEFAIFHPELIFDYLSQKKLCYKITSKAISKICDSFRITKEWKEKFKTIRSLY